MNLRILALGVVAVAVAVVAFAGTHSAPGHGEAADPGAMNLTVKSGGSAGACDDTKCSVFIGSDFTLAVEITKAPVGGYNGFWTELDVDGLIYSVKPSVTDEVVWVDATAHFSRSAVGSIINHTAATCVAPICPISNLEGNILELNMACPVAKGNHTVDLVPLDAGNLDGSSFWLDNLTTNATVAPDSLDINCIDPTLDTDGDGCSDGQELQANSQVSSGGGRDPDNFWDFYDVWTHPLDQPTQWERSRSVDLFGDIFGVANRFGTSRPGGPPSKSEALAEALVEPTDDTSYHTAFDRHEPFDANEIIVGSPNGAIDFFNDIFGVALQFGHDCS